MSTTQTITSTAEKWRYRCLAPERYGATNGHTNWFPIDGVFRCHGCAQLARHNPDIDPEYRELFDKKDERRVRRVDIVLE